MIAILTQQQKDLVDGQEFAPNQFFNPVQDINNDWVISEEEINQCTNIDFQWVKNLQLSQYQPKPTGNII